ncbi:MAG: TlpA family protein disulfide reductase [Bdellovibrionales bacterium]
METYDWKYLGKIAASIALSVIIGLFWISNTQKGAKITKNPHEFNLGSVFEEHLTDRTLVVFWASWCSSCKEDLEELKRFKASELPTGFSILAVNIDETKNLPQAKFIWSQLEISDITLLFDENADYQNLLSVDVLPAYFLFEKDGKTLLRLDGKIDLTDKKLLSLLFN